MTKLVQEIVFGNNTLRLETGEIARQADAAVFASMGGTQVLATVVSKHEGAEKNTFFPLIINYQEKSYAAGKIPGGYNKREGRPSVHETLTARLIDRPIRPLFPKGYRSEVQVIITVLSLNPDVSADIVSMLAASAALSLSNLPFKCPIGAARVGYKEGVYLLNPNRDDLNDSALDLVVAGTTDAILMVESRANELSEEVMLGAVLFGHDAMQAVITGINALAEKAGVVREAWEAPGANEALVTRIYDLAQEKIASAYLIKDKIQRNEQLNQIRQEVVDSLEGEALDDNFDLAMAPDIIATLEKTIVRNRILDGEPRIDGRDLETVRPIAIRTGLLDRTHGSALFTRGETQVIAAATLGNDRDAQLVDNLDGEIRDRFMLHYNFPPYSVGEVGMVGSPKRREIGHGSLARKALHAVLPTTEAFPYVTRVVSDVTESNGSSSMATVCGSSLALMDAGVPLKAPVAGVAMGLIKEGDKFAVLTDILGDEDHLGDMDFKVAGTENGVTALQMDIKITGITQDIMERALAQALAGRQHILSLMNNALSEHRENLSEHAPRIHTMKVAEDKIRTVIGKGGATIKGIIESTGVSVDIDDKGLIQLFSPNLDALEEAAEQIKLLVADIEVGQTYQGRVNKIVDFGAFVNLLPGKDGLLHISQICEDRSQKVEDVLQEGQSIEVYVASTDKQGRVKLEWKDKPVKTQTASDNVETVDNNSEEQEDKESTGNC